MAVRRIVADLFAQEPANVAAFYKRLFGLEVVMDQGFITTLASAGTGAIQLSIASEGGSGTAVPTLSIEVDDWQETYERALEMGLKIEYGPVLEPWGVRRFYLRDPSNNLLNILTHADLAATSGDSDDV
jgi:catechol 2,3-dioxygenase-like lactoylglutathione lyase family enzyme